MKKNTVLYAALAGLLLSTGATFAQQGMGTNNPDASSVLDMQSSQRGLLIPRLELKATNIADPVSNPAQSLLVYNTDTKGSGATAVKPGYYYWDVNKWQRVVNVDDVTTIVGNATDNDTKVTSFTIDNSNGLKLTFTDGTSKTVSIADLKSAIDTNTTYTGSNSVVLSGTTFKRAALVGDVSASEDSNNVTVTKIQGKSVATTAPNSGQVLQWNGSAWAPVTLADASSKVTAATLTGNILKLAQDGGAPEVTVDLSALATDNDTKVTGFEINSTDGLKITLSDGSTKKIPLATLKGLIDTDTTYTGSTSIRLNGSSFEREALTGDVTAALNSNTVKVTKIQGKEIDATAPQAGQVLQWDNTANKWKPSDLAVATEVDGVIGNEIKDVIANRGLERTGAGTTSDPYKVGLVAGSSAGQVMKWNGTKWAAAADASSKVVSGEVSGNNLTLTQDGGASNVVIDVSSLATDNNTKVTGMSLSGSNVLSLTQDNGGGTVTVDLSALATDTNTQSRETVSAGTGITVTPTGGTDNKNFEVAITPAGASESKVLGSTNGTVAWIDAPSSGPNFGNGEIRSVPQITAAEWEKDETGAPSKQFALIQTGTSNMVLPTPSQNKNRIIAVHNATGIMLTYGGNGPSGNNVIQSRKGQLIMCDGTKWVVIGGL